MLSMLGKDFSRQPFEIILIFFPEIGFEISCKLSPCLGDNLQETSRKNKKNIINLFFDQLAHRLVKIKNNH